MRVFGLVPLLVLCLRATSFASAVVYDHFADGELDPAWEVVFNEYACGWTYEESWSDLHVTEICHDGPAGEWASVALHAPCSLPADFHAAWRFGWAAQYLFVRQVLYLLMIDETGSYVACTGYHDPWISWRGEKVAVVRGSDGYFSGFNTLPEVGDAAITVIRTGGWITCLWGDEVLLEAPEDTPITSMELRFYYTWTNEHATSIDESVDFIRIVDSLTPVPERGADFAPRLMGAFPNPFNPQTTIKFTMASPQRATIAIYDLTGRRIAVLTDNLENAGEHAVVWNGRDATGCNLPSGTYFVRLQTGSGVDARKITLVE